MGFSAPTAVGRRALEKSFLALGFSRVGRHRHQRIDLYQQGQVRLLLSHVEDSHSGRYAKRHGPCIAGIGLTCIDADHAAEEATRRDAERNHNPTPLNLPSVYGVGGILLHFVDGGMNWNLDFKAHPEPIQVPGRGIIAIDHFATRVSPGTIRTCANFYKGVFGFTETVRPPNAGTGVARLLGSPCGAFYIPLIESAELHSGSASSLASAEPGIHHVALRTEDIQATLHGLRHADMPLQGLAKQDALICGHEHPELSTLVEGGLLVEQQKAGPVYQIFSEPVIGSGRWEIIQRSEVSLPRFQAWRHLELADSIA